MQPQCPQLLELSPAWPWAPALPPSCRAPSPALSILSTSLTCASKRAPRHWRGEWETDPINSLDAATWFWAVGGKNCMHTHWTMSIRLKNQELTSFSDCHRCCLWVSVQCSHLPPLHIWAHYHSDQSPHLPRCPDLGHKSTFQHAFWLFIPAPPQAQQRESLHLHYNPLNNLSSELLYRIGGMATGTAACLSPEPTTSSPCCNITQDGSRVLNRNRFRGM